MRPLVSILVPHFQTRDLSRLCLRLLAERTPRRDVETIVIDNGSRDGSGVDLGQFPGVRVIRREIPPAERPALSHGLALNLGVDHANAPFILTMHTDTMVLRSDWLDFLLASMNGEGPTIGAVGSWKLEQGGALSQAFRSIRRGADALFRRPEPKRYLRSHCALFRREAIETRPDRFAPSAEAFSAGEELCQGLAAAGFVAKFLPPGQLAEYIAHLNHATMALNPHFGEGNPNMSRTRARALRRIRRFLEKTGQEAPRRPIRLASMGS